MDKRLCCNRAAAVFWFFGAMAAAAAPPQFTTLATFPQGTYVNSPLVQGTDGDFYGTTRTSSTSSGTIFKVTTQGTLTTIYSFCSLPDCTDGSYPGGGLALGIDGNFYGTAWLGGANGYGTVFQVTPAGVLTTLHDFDSTDGAYPSVGLTLGAGGDFFGRNWSGGIYFTGTIFKISPSGALTTLYNFDIPVNAGDFCTLLQGREGDFYGTTWQGGAYGGGSIFEMTPAGAVTTFHSFNGVDGAYPQGALVQAADGDLYGTTAIGGSQDKGTVFKITPSGALTTLYSFGEFPHGGGPECTLLEAPNGKFYGTTPWGGDGGGSGTIFEITSDGKLSTLHGFRAADGQPAGGLVQGTDGIFYGTAGSANGGNIYSLSIGLPSFVKPVPTSGTVGSAVIILGNNLTGVTSVSFNGTAAAFTVVSPTEITATVPVGATTGKIQVITPAGTLSSGGRFIVAP